MTVYLKDAQERLGELLDGMKLDYEDVHIMQLLCAYKVRRPISFFALLTFLNRLCFEQPVALGYSSFCSLFHSIPVGGL